MLKHLRCAVLATALCAGAAAHATTITPASDGQWNLFDIDDLSSTSGALEWIDLNDGSTLGFAFLTTQRTRMTVVDAGFAGDRFLVSDNGVVLGATSLVVDSFPDSIGLDFDAALAGGAFSRRSFVLDIGSHLISGRLGRSAFDELGNAINATVGAVRFTSVAAPEAGTALAASLGLLFLALLRRRVVR